MSEENFEQATERIKEMLKPKPSAEAKPPDDLPRDYMGAAAAVVAAARELEDAKADNELAEGRRMEAFKRKSAAEEKLSRAIENLKHADTGRGGQES